MTNAEQALEWARAQHPTDGSINIIGWGEAVISHPIFSLNGILTNTRVP